MNDLAKEIVSTALNAQGENYMHSAEVILAEMQNRVRKLLAPTLDELERLRAESVKDQENVRQLHALNETFMGLEQRTETAESALRVAREALENCADRLHRITPIIDESVVLDTASVVRNRLAENQARKVLADWPKP